MVEVKGDSKLALDSLPTSPGHELIKDLILVVAMVLQSLSLARGSGKFGKGRRRLVVKNSIAL